MILCGLLEETKFLLSFGTANRDLVNIFVEIPDDARLLQFLGLLQSSLELVDLRFHNLLQSSLRSPFPQFLFMSTLHLPTSLFRSSTFSSALAVPLLSPFIFSSCPGGLSVEACRSYSGVTEQEPAGAIIRRLDLDGINLDLVYTYV